MANEITLQSVEKLHPVDENLRPIKVGGKSTAIETAQHGNGARVNGDLEVTGDIKGNIKDMVLEDVTLDSLTTNSIVSTDLTIDDSGDITLDADGGNVYFKDNGVTYIDFQVDGSNDKMVVTGSLTIDTQGAISLDSGNGRFIAMNAGTEFSAANASYAGMCLGYTALLIDDAAANYAVTTTMTVVSDDHKVVFTAPPSGNVEIGVDIFADCGAGGRWMVFGLSSQNATSGYLTVDAAHEHRASVGDETDEIYLHHRWTITGLTAGTEYTYWLGADAQTSSVWVLRWGGLSPGLSAANYAPFIMKATALPATIYTG